MRRNAEFIDLSYPIAGDIPSLLGNRRVHHDFGAAVGGVAQAAGAVGAAELQSSAANHAADLQSLAAANSLGFNREVFNKQQENIAPWLQAGRGALGQLQEGTAPGGNLVTPYGEQFQQPGAFQGPAPFDGGPAFRAPTTVDEQNDPGYQFRLQQGEQALLRGQSAAGGAFSGGTLKALQRYGQDYASNEYGNVYNRALGAHQVNFNEGLQQYQNNFDTSLKGYQTNFNNLLSGYNTRFNAYNTSQGNQYNRLAGLAGTGQNALGQLNAAGSQAAASNAAIAQGGANAAGNYLTQGANAGAAGIIGVGNAITGGINNYQNQQILQQLASQNGSGYGPSPYLSSDEQSKLTTDHP